MRWDDWHKRAASIKWHWNARFRDVHTVMWSVYTSPHGSYDVWKGMVSLYWWMCRDNTIALHGVVSSLVLKKAIGLLMSIISLIRIAVCSVVSSFLLTKASGPKALQSTITINHVRKKFTFLFFKNTSAQFWHLQAVIWSKYLPTRVIPTFDKVEWRKLTQVPSTDECYRAKGSMGNCCCQLHQEELQFFSLCGAVDSNFLLESFRTR